MEVLFTYFFIYFFIFSLISLTRFIFNFISVLLSNPPRPFILSENSIIYHGITLSYVITFIIYLIS